MKAKPLVVVALYAALVSTLAAWAAPKGKPLAAMQATGASCGAGVAHCVVLSWNASTDAVDGYNVYRSTASGAEAAPAINTTLTADGCAGTSVSPCSYLDANVVVGGSYFYVVRAVKSGVESLNSNEASAQIRPAAPANLKLQSQ